MTSVTGYSTAEQSVIGYYDSNGNFIQYGAGGSGGSNASVSATGSAVPADATFIGIEDSSGNLQGASTSNPVPIVGTVNITQTATANNAVNGYISVTGTSSTSLISAVSGKHIYVTGWSFSNSSATAVTIAFQDGNGGTTLGTIEVPAGGGNNMSAGSAAWFNTSSGNALYIQASASASTIYALAVGFWA